MAELYRTAPDDTPNPSPPPLPNPLAAAERMARQGGYAALLETLFLVTQIVAAFSSTRSWFTHPYYADPWVRIDVVIVLVLAIAMFTRNRPLTAILFIASAIEPFYLFSETGSIWRLLLQVAFFVFYARGFVGVFRYHFIAGSSQMPFFARLTIIGLLLILVPLIALGLLVQTQMVPETATITGDELRPNVTRFLIEREILERDEEVLYAYFGGIFSYAEDGNILTDRRAISYAQLDSEESFYAAVPYEEIESVDIEYGDWLNDTTVTLQSLDWEEVILYFSAETDTHRAAGEYLLSRTPSN